jgi:SOS-response transcriptional repressor LexA
MPHIIKYDRHDILDYIIAYKKKHDGNSPTFRNIMQACGISSLSHVQYILIQLEEQGLIRLAVSNAKAIEVVGGRWEYTPA